MNRSNRVNLDLNSKINDKNILRVNTLIWFDGSGKCATNSILLSCFRHDTE